jgi:hypothetical protein
LLTRRQRQMCIRDRMTAMLKVGFEYEHYHPQRRQQYLERLRGQLTSSEQWILESVCPA